MHNQIRKSDLSPESCICNDYEERSAILLACQNCGFTRSVLTQYVLQYQIKADQLCSKKFWNHRTERLHEYMTESWPRFKNRKSGKRVFLDGVRSRTNTTIAIIEAIENGRAQTVVELFYKDEENDSNQFE